MPSLLHGFDHWSQGIAKHGPPRHKISGQFATNMQYLPETLGTDHGAWQRFVESGLPLFTKILTGSGRLAADHIFQQGRWLCLSHEVLRIHVKLLGKRHLLLPLPWPQDLLRSDACLTVLLQNFRLAWCEHMKCMLASVCPELQLLHQVLAKSTDFCPSLLTQHSSVLTCRMVMEQCRGVCMHACMCACVVIYLMVLQRCT